MDQRPLRQAQHMENRPVRRPVSNRQLDASYAKAAAETLPALNWSNHRIERQIANHYPAQGWMIAASAELAAMHAGYVDGLTDILIERGAAPLPLWLTRA